MGAVGLFYLGLNTYLQRVTSGYFELAVGSVLALLTTIDIYNFLSKSDTTTP